MQKQHEEQAASAAQMPSPQHPRQALKQQLHAGCVAARASSTSMEIGFVGVTHAATPGVSMSCRETPKHQWGKQSLYLVDAQQQYDHLRTAVSHHGQGDPHRSPWHQIDVMTRHVSMSPLIARQSSERRPRTTQIRRTRCLQHTKTAEFNVTGHYRVHMMPCGQRCDTSLLMVSS